MEPKEEKIIIEDARQWSEISLRTKAGEFEEQGAVPRDVIDAMGERRYLGATFPKEYGGLGLDPVTYGLLTEEIGKGCASTRSLLTVHTSLVGESILRWGTLEQKKKWLPQMASGKKIAAFALTEPDVGTDAKNVKTTHEKKGGSCVLNGRKKWITFGNIADMFLVVSSNEGQVTTFIVEKAFDGVETRPMKGLLAGRAAYIAEIEFDNVRVPEENILGKAGQGFTFVVNTALDHGRYSIAWAGVALAQAALEEMVTYARQRQQFGKRIYEFQLIRGMIGDAITKVHAARALCLRAGELRKQKNDAAIIETTLAKYYSSKIAMEVATDSVQVHGGNGCYNQYPAERLFREAKVLEIIEGTSQIQQEMISKFGLSKYNRGKGCIHKQ